MKNIERKIVIPIIAILITSFLVLEFYISFKEKTIETSEKNTYTVTLGKNNSNITVKNDTATIEK